MERLEAGLFVSWRKKMKTAGVRNIRECCGQKEKLERESKIENVSVGQK